MIPSLEGQRWDETKQCYTLVNHTSHRYTHIHTHKRTSVTKVHLRFCALFEKRDVLSTNNRRTRSSLNLLKVQLIFGVHHLWSGRSYVGMRSCSPSPGEAKFLIPCGDLPLLSKASLGSVLCLDLLCQVSSSGLNVTEQALLLVTTSATSPRRVPGEWTVLLITSLL